MACSGRRTGSTPTSTIRTTWVNGSRNAPFDQSFFIILNVAVGGTNEYFPDGDGKPWSNSQSVADASEPRTSILFILLFHLSPSSHTLFTHSLARSLTVNSFMGAACR
eukprot:GEZU01042967.1.p1 GENE.GEZU01042967.1~~GEZU01042967.1.p1  ORF type:complete len:108 (+),score=5.98 GEZU01042967.1:175-498(+)